MLNRRVIFSADDFGLSVAVNEAVEQAHRDGVLTTASLMVAGDAAEDAVRRARAMPGLHVGLHVVVIEGRAVLPSASLLDENGWFPSDQLRLGLRYGFDRLARRALRAEIAAQFDAFARTGLRLDHANAHKHMHLHPAVARMIIEEGRAHGLAALRIPAEPGEVLRACGETVGFGSAALARWTALLRWQARRAGLLINDHVFGIAWSGHMTEQRVAGLIPRLPAGLSEIYFHPATCRDPLLCALMPNYEHEAELAALVSPAIRAACAAGGVGLATFQPA